MGNYRDLLGISFEKQCNTSSSWYSCIRKCVHKRKYACTDVTSRGARGIGDTEYLESTRIERAHRAITIHMIYIFRGAARIYAWILLGTRLRVHACVRSIFAVAEAPAMLQTEAESPLSLFVLLLFGSSSPYTSVPSSNGTGQSGRICIHTTSHTRSALISPAMTGN